ncbi:MAG: polymerase factor sigma-54, partial [Bacteroidota bacterium]
MALYQGLQQRLQQKLSPQQIQLMKLLQVPTLLLEERIKEEMEDNPALELGQDDYEEKDPLSDEDQDADPIADSDNLDEDLSYSEYGDDDDIAEYKLKEDQVPELQGSGNIPHPTNNSLHELLSEQLRLLNLEEDEAKIAEQIIGSIDDDGYLRRDTNSILDDLAFKQNVVVEQEQVEALILKIQHFDPAGIAARDVQECLLLQLRRKILHSSQPALKHALRIVEFHFDEFTKRHFDKISKSLDINEDQLKDAIAEIRRLNPRPGGQVGSVNKAEQYIVPDFLVYNNNGEPELTLNQKNAPDLRISDDYR